VPTVTRVEEQLITCVGLAPVKPGVFMPAVRYVLVVCTSVEVVLLGVCFAGDNTSHQVEASLSPPCVAAASSPPAIAQYRSLKYSFGRKQGPFAQPLAPGSAAVGMRRWPQVCSSKVGYLLQSGLPYCHETIRSKELK
jgi:hypothetical protein